MSLNSNHKSLLRSLIGSSVSYRGKSCVVLELLEEEASLVLQTLGPRDTMQANQFGDPGHHVAELFTLPLLADDGSGELHPEFYKLTLSDY